MKRRNLLRAALACSVGPPLTTSSRVMAAINESRFDAAMEVLEQATVDGRVEAAELWVRHRSTKVHRLFGEASGKQAIFLLASISKPISIAALMTLYDQKAFGLDDPVRRFLPEFTGDGRDQVTLRHLLTHRSGLPDHVPENQALRARHAPLSEFVSHALRVPLQFRAGAEYSYSSMGILLAAEVAERIGDQPFADLVDQAVFRPLGMKHSALGVGDLDRSALMRCQVEKAAPESGAGDPATEDWNWNSNYWRELGSPWGGAHGSAADVARFLDAFLHVDRATESLPWLSAEARKLMIRNHNPEGLRPRGLGFDLGSRLSDGHSSERTFGHGGSTGTLCWADPDTDSICVVLTTLPSRAVDPHPRETTARRVAQAIERMPDA